MKKINFGLLQILVLLGLVVASCSPAAPAPIAAPLATAPAVSATVSGPVRGGILRVGRAEDVLTWDPMVINDNGSMHAGLSIYSTLLKASPDGKSLQPYLADSYTVNKDYTELTFQLNSKAAFCDGSQITSSDVMYSWERAIPSGAVDWMFPKDIKMSAPDPHTFTIKLAEPNVAMDWWTTLWGMAVVSKAYGESHSPEDMASKPLGSGPFCLKEWKPTSETNYIRNTHYWMSDEEGIALPYVDEIRVFIIPDANARVLKLQAGEIDIAEDIPANQVAPLKDAKGIDVQTSQLMGTGVAVLNMRTPFSDPKIRKAAAYATDRDALVAIVLSGLGTPAYNFLSSGKYANDEYGIHYDLDMAKKLMEGSSMPKGFKVEMMVRSGDPVGEQVAIVLKDQLAKIGIEIAIASVEGGTYSQRRSDGDYDMLYKFGTLDIYDSSENLNYDINLAAFSGWHDDAIWKLAQEASAQPDPVKRAAQFDELQKRVMEVSPYILLLQPANAWANSTKVHGFVYRNTGLHPFELSWLQTK